MNRCFMGIDPGLSGACAFYFTDHPLHVSVHDMPVVGGIVEGASLKLMLEKIRPDHAFIEQVNAMPGGGKRRMGATSAFNFGRSCGIPLGVIQGMGIPHTFVRPQEWKKYFRLGPDKEKSRALALATFTEATKHFIRKMDEGRADAALIALYGAQTIITSQVA